MSVATNRRGFLAAALATAALAKTTMAEPSRAAAKSIPVIFHTDIGYDVDDTWALLLLLRRPELDLKLVVTDVSNMVYRARVAAKLLALGGRHDVVIAVGPDATDTPGPQSDWVGDFDLKTYGGPVRYDGAQAIVDTIMASPDPVTIISTGPATLSAAALKLEPRIAARARFVAMDGSVRVGYGGAARPEAEYNVRVDPAALQAVFDADWLSCSITPVDTCGLLVLDGEDIQKVNASSDPFAQACIHNTEVWLPNAPWMPKDFDITKTSSTLFDAVAVVMAYDESDLVMEDLKLTVTPAGMTIEDPAGRPVRVATKWRDLAHFKHEMVAALTARPA